MKPASDCPQRKVKPGCEFLVAALCRNELTLTFAQLVQKSFIARLHFELKVALGAMAGPGLTFEGADRDIHGASSTILVGPTPKVPFGNGRACEGFPHQCVSCQLPPGSQAGRLLTRRIPRASPSERHADRALCR